MAIKLIDDGCIFPTEVKDGVLSIYIGEDIKTVSVPWLKHDYEKECYHFNNGSLCAYFSNDDSKTVMRWGGTATSYNSRNIVIGLKSGIKITPESLGIQVFEKCSILDGDIDDVERQILVKCQIYIINDKVLLSPSNINGFLELDTESKLVLMNDIGNGPEFYPCFIEQGDGTLKSFNCKSDYVLYGKWWIDGEVR